MHRNKEISLSIFGADEARFDAHFHLSWVQNLPQYLQEQRACGLKVFANTVTPADYESLLSLLQKGDDELLSSASLTRSGNLDAANELEQHLSPAREFRDPEVSETPARQNLQAQSRFRSRSLVKDINFGSTLSIGDDEFCAAVHNGDDELCAERKKCAFSCGNDELHNGDDEFCTAVHNGDDEFLKVGLGLHPWYVQDADVERFEQLCGTTDFIGEVGLDFSRKFSASQKEAQVAAFERVARAVSEADNSAEKPKILSIHSCKTAGRTHEIFSKAGCLENCILIYHWFNDDFATLQKCIKDGCLFSVNERMLTTKNGAEIARQIPRAQMLFETDWPARKGAAVSAKDELAAIIYAWEKLTKTENATSR